jgi:hypothetical protein
VSEQIIRQPDGRLAVFSSVVEAFVVVDATPEEIIEYRAEEAARKARERTQAEIDRVLSGQPRPYHQFTLTWEEAARLERENAPAAPRPGPGISR